MRRFVFVAILIASGWSQARSQCSDPKNTPPDNSNLFAALEMDALRHLLPSSGEYVLGWFPG